MTKRIFAAFIFITFSFGSLPEGMGGENVAGGLFVIGFSGTKPNPNSHYSPNGIFITSIEF